jgi:hypothetical protein
MPVVERLARLFISPSLSSPPKDLQAKLFIFNSLAKLVICKIVILNGLRVKSSF